jgi:hypothetical protein
MREWSKETVLRGSVNRLFQLLARILPSGMRIVLHRARGVHIGSDIFSTSWRTRSSTASSLHAA